MRPIPYAGLALGSLLLFAAHAQPQNPVTPDEFGLEPGAYAVGFRLLEAQDDSRAVTGGIAATAQPRPIRTYLWYPAETTAQPMRFGRYAALADEDIWPAHTAGSLRDERGSPMRPCPWSSSWLNGTHHRCALRGCWWKAIFSSRTTPPRSK